MDAKRRRSALPAAPAAEPAAAVLCTPAAARFAERSCAAVEAQMPMEEQPDAPQWEPLAERSPKLPKALPQLEPMPPEVASLGAPARSRVTMKPVTISQQEV